MPLSTLIALALSLAMDSFAASVAEGCAARQSRLGHRLRAASLFAAVQALMPLIGWSAGHGIRSWIEPFGHWAAFAILVFVGIKMIYEGRYALPPRGPCHASSPRVLFALAVATSFDALAVGFSLSLLRVHMLRPVLVIAVVTFAMSLAGLQTGRSLGHLFEGKVETAGGLVLIAIGFKILWAHA